MQHEVEVKSKVSVPVVSLENSELIDPSPKVNKLCLIRVQQNHKQWVYIKLIQSQSTLERWDRMDSFPHEDRSEVFVHAALRASFQ